MKNLVLNCTEKKEVTIFAIYFEGDHLNIISSCKDNFQFDVKLLPGKNLLHVITEELNKRGY